MLEFICKLLGLDAKARGLLAGYRTYLVAFMGLMANIGPVLIGFASILGVILQFVDGKIDIAGAMAQIKPLWLAISPKLNVCLGFNAMAYARAGIARHFDQLKTAQTQPGITVLHPAGFNPTENDLNLSKPTDKPNV